MVIRCSEQEFVEFLTEWVNKCEYEWLLIGPVGPTSCGETLEDLGDVAWKIFLKASHIFYDGDNVKIVTLDAEVYTLKRVTYLGHKVKLAIGHLTSTEELCKILNNKPLVE